MCFPSSPAGIPTVQWIEDTQFISIEVPWRLYGTKNLVTDVRRVQKLLVGADVKPQIEVVDTGSGIYGHVHLGPCQTLPLLLPWLLRNPNALVAQMLHGKEEGSETELFERTDRVYSPREGDNKKKAGVKKRYEMVRRLPYRLFYFDGPGGTSPCVQFPQVPDGPPPEASCFQFKLQNPNYHMEHYGVKMYCPNMGKTDPMDGKILAPSADDPS